MSAPEVLAKPARANPGVETRGDVRSPEAVPLGASGKLQPHHQERLAMVYVRQSSPQQVLEHRESTAQDRPLLRAEASNAAPIRRAVPGELPVRP